MQTTKEELFSLMRSFRRAKDNYILKENGNFLAAVIAREEYEKYLSKRQAEAQVGLEKVLAKIHSQVEQNISDEDLQKEIDEAIHEMRGVE